jgi:hypothetical protein
MDMKARQDSNLPEFGSYRRPFRQTHAPRKRQSGFWSNGSAFCHQLAAVIPAKARVKK